jgi:hypothetical protein
MVKHYVFGVLVGAALLVESWAGAQAPRQETPPTDTAAPTAAAKAGDVDLRRPCTFMFQVEAGATQLRGMCPNHYGGSWEIAAVACDATSGDVTVLPRLAQGADDSVLASPLTCGVNGPAGVLTPGKPRLNPRGANGATCATAPCDLEITIRATGPAAGLISIVSTVTVGAKP